MYSQWQEDEILIEFFQDQATGFFVDVGAHDGIHLSNTYALELAGWTGICIEAHPEYADRCRRNRSGSVCVHGAAIGDDQRDRVTLYAEPGGLFSSLSSDEGPAKRHYRHNMSLPFGGFQDIEVPALTLNSVLTDVTWPIDLISIDVEGSELDVLAGLNLEKHRPRVLRVEANSAPAARQMDHYLSDRGYRRVGRTGVNYFYCSRPEDASRLLESLKRVERARKWR